MAAKKSNGLASRVNLISDTSQGLINGKTPASRLNNVRLDVLIAEIVSYCL